MVGLKAHGKTTLVVRREGEAIRRYGHIGTGNYNPDTARSYEDLGLFTADPAICADLSEFFNYLTAYSNQQCFRKLWVAPRTLRSQPARADPARGGARRRPHHHQGQCPGRPGADRRALPRLPGGGRDRPHRPRRVLPATGRAGPVRADPGALDRRSLPRAFPHLPLRQRRAGPALRDRLGRHDDAQPRPAGRGGDARRGSRARGSPRAGPRGVARGRRARLAARCERRLATGRTARAARTPRRRCSRPPRAGPSARRPSKVRNPSRLSYPFRRSRGKLGRASRSPCPPEPARCTGR